jgi:phosphate transport system substrate-binding protein
MAKKNETLPLLLAFLLTTSLTGAGVWWLTQKSGLGLGFLTNPNPRASASSSPMPPASTSPNAGNSPDQLNPLDFRSVANVPNGLFNYGGSTTWAPIRLIADQEIQKARPEFRLRYVHPFNSAPGSGTGIRMLLDDQLAFSQSSRPTSNKEFQEAERRGYKLKQIPVAIDGVAIAAHPELKVAGLTVSQVANIYLGKIKNWQEVGGPDLAILPLGRIPTAGGTPEFFVNEILNKQPYGTNVQLIKTTTEALRVVAKTPGSIYYASAPEVVPQCKVKALAIGRSLDTLTLPYVEPFVSPSECPARRNQLNAAAFQSGQYPITRNLYVIVKQNGGSDQQAGEAYANLLLTSRGQELIAQAGYVRLR